MIARPGYWLIVSGRTDHHAGRRGEILAVPSASGEPPYTIRWLDTGQTALVFPGPDAVAVSPAALAELDQRAAERIAAVQSSIVAHSGVAAHPAA